MVNILQQLNPLCIILKMDVRTPGACKQFENVFSSKIFQRGQKESLWYFEEKIENKYQIQTKGVEEEGFVFGEVSFIRY